jgi:hypothetical protein
MKTARSWVGKSIEAVPWRDPWKVLDWYRVAFGREPGKRVRDRVVVLGPQAGRSVDSGKLMVENGAEVPPVENSLDLREMMVEICGELGNARTIARITNEERKAFDKFEATKAANLDASAERREWLDVTKIKREWVKTQDAVDVALGLLKHWARGEWEVEWKELRVKLDGRRLGMDAREVLMAVADDPVEWRRIWDMEMERAIAENFETTGLDS